MIHWSRPSLLFAFHSDGLLHDEFEDVRAEVEL